MSAPLPCAAFRSVPQPLLVAENGERLNVLSGLQKLERRFLWVEAVLLAGCWVSGDFLAAHAVLFLTKKFKKGFFDECFLKAGSGNNDECATDGCTVGHLYLSQMIFGQGDPWSLV